MKLSSRSLLAAAVALASQSVWSADTYINVFFDSTPMKGIEVKFNGDDVGETDERGAAEIDIDAGDHTIELYRDGVRLSTHTFATVEDQDAEISISFTDESSKPEVKLAKFDEDDKSASGFVGGIIRNKSGNPVEGAEIFDLNSDASVFTDESGAYELELPRGEYTLNVSHPNFSGATIRDVRVLANLGVSASLTLSPKLRGTGIDVSAPVLIQGPLEEVLTLGTYKPSDTSLGLERFSTNVVDALDVATMARFGDGNIAAALTRLAGVAVTGGQYANVRGLDGRYISVSLNGFLMPSTDPLTRDIQLDLFPSGILNSVEVQKNYSPDLLGSTTGGSLGISTKGLPDGKTFKVKAKIGGNADITGDDILTHKGSNGEWLGADLGLRDLSQDVLDATDQGLSDPEIDNDDPVSVYSAAAYSVAFEDDYNTGFKKANPEVDLAISYGDILDSGLFGYYGSLSYSYDTSARLNAILDDPFGVDDGGYQRSEESYSLDGYLVLGSQFRHADEILSKTILLRDSGIVTEERSGEDIEDNQRNRTYLEWTERQFFSQQFEGKHAFDIGSSSHDFNWGVSFSNTNLYQPDRRQYEYLAGFLILNGLERRWLELDEDSVDVRANYILPFELGSSIYATVKAGVLVSDKERDVEQYRFGWKRGRGALAGDVVTIDQNLEDVFSYGQLAADTYRLDVKTANTDSFFATETISAAYLDLSAEIGDAWTLTLGARQEEFEQEIEYANQPSANNGLETDNVLPAFSLTFAPNDTWQFRAAASQTISYPGIVERSLAKIFREDGREQVGNPNLEPSSIDNLDFRIEYYLSDEESISLAFFNKVISDPIEVAIIDGSGSATDGNTFRQSPEATLMGVELDGRVNIFDTGSWLGFVSGNLTFIESEVDLDEDSLRLEGEAAQGRELQGQSPFLANLQFGFDHFPTDQKLTLLVNYFDDRIYTVQRLPREPMFELGRTELNLNYEKVFDFESPLTFKAQLKNLLNEEVVFDIGGQTVESYEEGIEYAIELSWEY